MSTIIAALFGIFLFASPLFAQRDLPPEMQAALDDIGITQADIMQFGVNLAGTMEEYREKFQDRFKEPPTSANYKEHIGQAIDELGFPLSDVINQEMKDFLTPDQYQKVQTRFFQFSHSVINAAENTTDTEVMGAALGGSVATFLGPPDFLEFTDDQKRQLQQLQKETILDIAGVVIPHEEKRDKLRKELSEATTDEQRAEIQKQLDDMGSGGRNILPQVVSILIKAKKKFEKILTDKQKAKMQEVMDDIPDYLWALMPHNKDKERAWRPGANSWRPGMGVPDEMGDANREARSPRPEGGRSFPGQDDEEEEEED